MAGGRVLVPNSRQGRGRVGTPSWRALATVTVVAVLLGPTTVHAGQSSWDTLATDLPRAVRAIDIHGGTGWAVGDAGLLLELQPDESWVERPSPTGRDLYDVDLRDATHGIAVGADGIILELAPAWGQWTTGLPSGTATAYGTTTSGPETTRHVEWAVPLTSAGITPDDRFGLGVTTRAGEDSQTHPPGLAPNDPSTADALFLDDLPFHTPTIDGHPEPAWNDGLHASYSTGNVPFSLYLLRDADALYLRLSSTAPMDGQRIQLHGVYGSDIQPDDLQLDREGLETPTTQHRQVSDPAWTITASPGSLGADALHAATYLDEQAVVAGTDGILALASGTSWNVHTLLSGKTFRGADTRGDHIYLAGSATGGGAGAVIYRYNAAGESGQAMTIPTGTYGLRDIDMDACRAVGSHGRVLTCQDGNPSTWTSSSTESGDVLNGIAIDPNRQGRHWVTGEDDEGNGVLYYRDSGTDSHDWHPRLLPTGTSGVTDISAGLDGIVLPTLDLDILAFRPHAPTFVSIPASTTGYQGEEIRIPVEGDDEDGDHLDIDVIPEDPLPDDLGLPEPQEIIRNIWDLVWLPPFDIEGVFNFTVVLDDGDKQVNSTIEIIILDQNGPPYWDPHPDDVIPAGLPYTTQAQAHDPDGDPLVLTGPFIPPGSVFADLGGGLAQLDWTPSLADVGTHTVTFVADDGSATADLDFLIEVVDNEPPIIDSHTRGGTICVAGPFSSGTKTFRASAHDPEGQPITYTWHFSDDNSIETGWRVEHTFLTVGDFTVTLTVEDDVGLQTSVQIPMRIDDCVHAEVEPDSKCVDMLDRATGTIFFFNHTGEPINGTYEATVFWENALGQDRQRTFEGTITNGVAFYTVPYDNAPVPINDLGNHKIVVKASYENSIFGDTETHTAVALYYVCPDCALFDHKDDD